MKIYLAGPMAGYPEKNFPAFNTIASCLRLAGHEVLNPAEINLHLHGQGRAICMRRDIEAVMQCEAVAFMEGWMASAGAVAEWHVATQIGLALYNVDIYGSLQYMPDYGLKYDFQLI